MKKFVLYLCVCSALPCLAKAAVSNAEINAIKEEIKVLQRQVYRNNTDGSSATVGVAEMGEYDQMVRNAMGRMDELEHHIKKINERIDMINKDIEVRLNLLEGKQIVQQESINQPEIKKFDAQKAVDAPKSITGDAVLKAEDLQAVEGFDVNKIYKEGQDALKASDYAKAEEKFNQIINKFPGDKLAPNAHYWLGEVYYGKKDFAKAAVTFGKGYQTYKAGPKGADSLLKLGMSMRELKKTEEACAAFLSLEKEFPKASEELKSKAKSFAEKLQCKSN